VTVDGQCSDKKWLLVDFNWGSCSWMITLKPTKQHVSMQVAGRCGVLQDPTSAHPHTASTLCSLHGSSETVASRQIRDDRRKQGVQKAAHMH
jgi:hypothetical protein